MEVQLKTIISYLDDDRIFVTEHMSSRMLERGISISDLKSAIRNGEIIESYPDDFPFPSCLILGKSHDGKAIHIVLSDENDCSHLITAYYPDPEKWSNDLKERKN